MVTFSPFLTPSEAAVLRDLTEDVEAKKGLGSKVGSLPPLKEKKNLVTAESLGNLIDIHYP